jgi:hypothetical protein
MGRVPTSTENPIILGNISLDHTLLSKYPSASEQVFYLELRSSERTLVDVDSKDVKLLYQGKIVKITLQRLGQGRYTLEPIKRLDDVSKGVFKVQKKTLKNTLISLKKPSRLSHIKLVSNENYLLRLELTLLDKKGKPLISGQVPDIILEGLGEISELESRGNGAALRKAVSRVHKYWPLAFYFDTGELHFIKLKSNIRHGLICRSSYVLLIYILLKLIDYLLDTCQIYISIDFYRLMIDLFI